VVEEVELIFQRHSVIHCR